ncbi:unnamed protein product, partial [Symbiodinium microadriaticum]
MFARAALQIFEREYISMLQVESFLFKKSKKWRWLLGPPDGPFARLRWTKEGWHIDSLVPMEESLSLWFNGAADSMEPPTKGWKFWCKGKYKKSCISFEEVKDSKKIHMVEATKPNEPEHPPSWARVAGQDEQMEELEHGEDDQEIGCEAPGEEAACRFLMKNPLGSWIPLEAEEEEQFEDVPVEPIPGEDPGEEPAAEETVDLTADGNKAVVPAQHDRDPFEANKDRRPRALTVQAGKPPTTATTVAIVKKGTKAPWASGKAKPSEGRQIHGYLDSEGNLWPPGSGRVRSRSRGGARVNGGAFAAVASLANVLNTQ